MTDNKELKPESVARYWDTYTILRVNDISLDEMSSLSEQDFRERTGRGVGDFKLARSIARNEYVQVALNERINSLGFTSRINQPIEVKEYMGKAYGTKGLYDYTTFKKTTSKKFPLIKGKTFTLNTTPSQFKHQTKDFIREVKDKAIRETQEYTHKQIKVNITAEINPDKKNKDNREIATKSFQTLARIDKDNLEYDMFDLDTQVDGFITNYAPKGSITVSVSIVNYNA